MKEASKPNRAVEGTGNQDGYTLLEVLLAISIFMIGILAIGSMQAAALKGNSNAEGITQAVELAQYQIETLMSVEYDPAAPVDDLDPAENGNRIPAGAGPYTTLGQGAGPYQFTGDNNTYTLDWTVTTHPNIADAITIRVTVSWRDYGVNKQIVYDILRTEMI